MGIRVHVSSHATMATLVPRWNERDDATTIETTIEVVGELDLPLDLEVPGTGRTLEDVMREHFPQTLASLEGMVATYNLGIPNRKRLAAFAFRDAFRAFYEEATGERANHKAAKLRECLVDQLRDPDSGKYLEAAIALFESLYRPVAAQVYGRDSDVVTWRLWLRTAIDAMAYIVTAWISNANKDAK